MEFAENLMSLRRGRNWSQEELGDRLGVTRQTVSKWELGQTTPELEKLVEMAKLFGISLDELVGGGTEQGREAAAPCRSCRYACRPDYEYISPLALWGLPLVHIRLGRGLQGHARGIIAIGNSAVGVVAVGGVTIGLVSIGGLSVGLLALGGMSLGLAALGGVALGGFSLGGLAMGQWLACGGLAISNYLAAGGAAISNGLACGRAAVGHIAVGESAEGVFAYLSGQGIALEEVWAVVKREFPNMWGFVKRIIQSAL